MKIINFYSYKGGVGRTMLASQIARCLAALGKQVVVADFDFEAPGIPANFDKSIHDVKGGLFESFNEYKKDIEKYGKEFIKTDEYLEKFKELLNKYFMDIKLGLTGNDDSKTGNIRILPSGRLTNEYWSEIVSTEWLESLALDESREDSFSYFILNIIKHVLEKDGVDYLLVDARTGITYYGSIAQEIAERHVIVSCWNRETKEALENFLLPAMDKLLKEERHQTDRVVFVLSRVPPELYNLGEEVFSEFSKLIKNEYDNLSNMDILKLHSDLHIYFDSNIRSIDERFKHLLDERGFKYPGKEEIDIVKIHEDIFKILVALCPPDELLNLGEESL